MHNEVWIRLACFFGVLLIVALWEYVRPKRVLRMKRSVRWVRNLSLVALDTAVVRLTVPFTAASVALYAEQHHMGLLRHLPVSFATIVVISIVLLDAIIYAQHVMFHYTPVLWRLHKVHHIDQEIDVTTGVRFHPLEILLSTLIKCIAILLLGAPALAVVLFEILLNATAMFNHGNIALPSALDGWLRVIVVTPDMHRVHHSVIATETNSNFGFNLPWWDRLFGTYRAQPKRGHQAMHIGLKEYRNVERTGIWELLRIPFQRPARTMKEQL